MWLVPCKATIWSELCGMLKWMCTAGSSQYAMAEGLETGNDSGWTFQLWSWLGLHIAVWLACTKTL